MALLMVLFVIMAITVFSLGFLSRCDVELACGQNMLLRTQMDQLADSGLEHAKGLVLSPQEVSSEYWLGATDQQLIFGSPDYYDVNVTRDSSDPNDRCTYLITADAYRLKGTEQVGRSHLSAALRLDPCIAFWSGGEALFRQNWVLYGDIYAATNVINLGSIDGDVFSSALTGAITGTHRATADLSLAWPAVNLTDFTSRYTAVTIPSGSLPNVTDTFGPYDPPRVFHRSGDLTLNNNVTFNGMLLVDGNLTVRGNGNAIVAAKNLPALYVTGDLMVEEINGLTIEGLAVVDGRVAVSAAASNVHILGGLFVAGVIAETAPDSSGGNHDCLVDSAPTWQPAGGRTGGALEFDGDDDRLEDPLAGAYLNGLSAITVSLWVRSDVVGEDRGIIYSITPDDSDKYLGLRYDAYGAKNGANRCIKASIGTTSGYTQIESSADVQTTTWQHLALVWSNGSSLALYINGSKDSLSYDSGPLSGSVASVQKLTLGQGAYGRYWDGHLDDVRIYGRALDPNEVRLLHDSPSLDGDTSSLLARYKLDESGSGVTITAEPAKSAIVVWPSGIREHWNPATDAFFKSIRRN